MIAELKKRLYDHYQQIPDDEYNQMLYNTEEELTGNNIDENMDEKVNEALSALYNKLLTESEPLPRDYQAILDKHFWDLV